MTEQKMSYPERLEMVAARLAKVHAVEMSERLKELDLSENIGPDLDKMPEKAKEAAINAHKVRAAESLRMQSDEIREAICYFIPDDQPHLEADIYLLEHGYIETLNHRQCLNRK